MNCIEWDLMGFGMPCQLRDEDIARMEPQGKTNDMPSKNVVARHPPTPDPCDDISIQSILFNLGYPPVRMTPKFEGSYRQYKI